MHKKSFAFLIIIAYLFTISKAAVAALPEYYGSLQAPQVLNHVQFTDVGNHWAKGPILKMAAQGVIRGVGGNKYKPEDTLTKEQALILLLRSAGFGEAAEAKAEELAAVSGQKPDSITGFAIQGYLNVAVEEAILNDGEAAALRASRTKPVQRQEVAYWASKALGLSPVYGVNQKLIYGFSDVNQFDARMVASIEALLQEELMSGTSSTTFKPQSSMKRGEMAALLDRIYPLLAGKQNLILEKGVVVGKATRLEGSHSQTVLEIRTDSLQGFNLITGNTSQGRRNTIVYKNGTLGNSALLAVGDRIGFTMQPSGEIDFIEATPATSQMLFGQIASFDAANKRMTLTDGFGNNRILSITQAPIVVVDNRPATLNDLVIGQDVELVLKSGTIERINGTFGPELVGYTPPQKGIATGRIKSVDADELILVSDSGRQEVYQLTSGVWVSKSGSWKSISDLQVGDRVKVYLADKGTGKVDKIEIASLAGRVVRVIKGKLENTFPNGQKIALSSVQEFENGHWYKAEGFDFVELLPEAELYAKERNISYGELTQNFRGETIYLAFTSSFGKHEGVKLVVKDGEPQTYSDTIDNIGYGGYELDLAREANGVRLNPGTIVTKNHRLVDPEDLAENDQIFMEANRSNGITNSIVVAANTYYPKSWEIYKGRISSVEADHFRLNYYSEFASNAWNDSSSSTRKVDLDFDNDTIITDLTKTTDHEIPASKFAESRWSNYYGSDYYVFAIAKGDKVLNMALWDYYSQPGVLKTSLGKVTAVDKTNKKLSLERVVDYSDAFEQWKANDFPLTLAIDKAIIYREDEPQTINNIKVGETLYLIHDQAQGVVIFIQ